jgi:hypothetical protein
MPYTNSELLIFTYPIDDQQCFIQINYNKPVDRVRFTVWDSLQTFDDVGHGLLLYSNIVDNYIGACLTKPVSRDNQYIDFLTEFKNKNSIEYYYDNKITINGEHQIYFTDFRGLRDEYISQGEIYLLVEFYCD